MYRYFSDKLVKIKTRMDPEYVLRHEPCIPNMATNHEFLTKLYIFMVSSVISLINMATNHVNTHPSELSTQAFVERFTVIEFDRNIVVRETKQVIWF